MQRKVSSPCLKSSPLFKNVRGHYINWVNKRSQKCPSQKRLIQSSHCNPSKLKHFDWYLNKDSKLIFSNVPIEIRKLTRIVIWLIEMCHFETDISLYKRLKIRIVRDCLGHTSDRLFTSSCLCGANACVCLQRVAYIINVNRLFNMLCECLSNPKQNHEI